MTFLLLCLAGCAAAPGGYRETAPLRADERAVQNRRVFDRVWGLVNDRYYDLAFHGVDWPVMKAKYGPAALAAADEDALYEVLNRMCAELKDPHVACWPPRRVRDARTGYSADVGLRGRLIDGRCVVTAVRGDSPAADAGVLPGWIIVACQGNPWREEKFPGSLIERVGFPVALSFLDEHDRTRELHLEAQLLPVDGEVTVSRELSKGARFLGFGYFNLRSVGWLSRELKAHRGCPAVVLDLRANIGGEQVALQLAAREFFSEGRLLGRTVGRTGRVRPLDTLAVLPAKYEGRLVILIDCGTASSAEILARALQFYHRAVVVGRNSAGTVEDAVWHDLPGGGRMEVAEQDFIGPDGQRLEGHGVRPDVVVPPPTLMEIREGRDRDLETALQILHSL